MLNAEKGGTWKGGFSGPFVNKSSQLGALGYARGFQGGKGGSFFPSGEAKVRRAELLRPKKVSFSDMTGEGQVGWSGERPLNFSDISYFS